MPWTNQGGRGGGDGGGNGGGPWGGGQSPWGRPSRGPNIEDLIKRGQDRLRGGLPGGLGGSRAVLLILAVLLIAWFASGFYRVEPDQLGVVLRFGAVVKRTTPGLNWHWPYPIETALTPAVTRVNRVDIGYRPSERGPGRVQQVPEESLMLTGDENIVDINFFVLWHIKEATDYLFNLSDPDGTVKSAAESAMREVIGHTEIARALAPGRGQIEQETQKLLQDILDAYKSGIQVSELRLEKVDPPPQVIDAFRDVQSAKIDFTRLQNEADAYQNDVVPRAQGEAARLVQEAEAYKARIVQQSQGNAARFISVYEAYRAAPDVTARRLYIEMMEDVLAHTNKVIVDRGISTSGVVPYLPLPALNAAPPSSAAPAAPPAGRATGQPSAGASGTRP
ncbi:MAG TPA: FtsH protease activity modulator HflK [Stellaceae bacterium]|nr:FtsH protease activity modulator HflK [Stellaceae bacterium]